MCSTRAFRFETSAGSKPIHGVTSKNDKHISDDIIVRESITENASMPSKTQCKLCQWDNT